MYIQSKCQCCFLESCAVSCCNKSCKVSKISINPTSLQMCRAAKDAQVHEETTIKQIIHKPLSDMLFFLIRHQWFVLNPLVFFHISLFFLLFLNVNLTWLNRITYLQHFEPQLWHTVLVDSFDFSSHFWRKFNWFLLNKKNSYNILFFVLFF